MKEREKSEFARALNVVTESLNIVNKVAQSENAELAAFYQKRLEAIKGFFDTLDNLVATLITLDELRLSTIQKLFKKSRE